MGRPPDCNCHCTPCPTYVPDDPTLLNPLHVNYVSVSPPSEISDGHGYAVIFEKPGEGSLTTESVLEGAVTGSITVVADSRGAVQPGSRRLTINISTTDAPWVAGAILWDDSGHTYDPRAAGSLSRIRASAGYRYVSKKNVLDQLIVPPQTVGPPWILFGVVIEQDGNKYYSFEHDPTFFHEDTCWRLKRFGAEDAENHQYLGRLATHDEGWHTATGTVPDRGGYQNRLGRVDDWLAALGADGEFNIDQKPDVSYDSAVSRPVTRFGLFFGLMSEPYDSHAAATRAPAGNYNLDILLDDLLLSTKSWGVPKVYTADAGSPPDFGTTYVDEPMTAIPAWPQSGAAVRKADGTGDESCASGGFATLVNGTVANEQTWNGEYTAFRMSTTPTLPVISDTGTITMEFTWHTLDERDHTLPIGDTTDPELSRRVWAGVWLSNGCRFLARKNSEAQGIDDGNHRWEMQGQLQYDAQLKYQFPVNSVYGGDDYLMTSTGLYTGYNSEENYPGKACPMDGDRITIMLRRQYTSTEAAAINAQLHDNVLNGVYDQPPFHLAYPEARWVAYAWVNGRVGLFGSERSVTGGTHSFLPSTVACAFLWFDGQVGGPTIFGLLGMCGGRWSDVRLKVRV